MINVAMTVQDLRYYRKIKKIRSFCAKIIKNAWMSREPVEVSLLLTDDAVIQLLNKQYRQKDCPTNVLSFESGFCPKRKRDVWLAGDIVTSYDTVLREAQAQGKTFEAHFAHLLTHGTLHLQGYDHIELEDAVKMEALETRLMLQLGYEDPYKDVI